MGLTFDEMNELRVQDFLDFAYAFNGTTNKNRKRKATQADIDKFF